MLGNDSCGTHSLLCAKHGRGLRTADNTEELEVLTCDGARMRVGATPPAELERIIQAGGRRGEIYVQLKALVERYGEAIRNKYPKLPRRVSGYNLPQLLPENGFNVARALVGSESTLVTILEATLNLVPNPQARTTLVLGYPDVYEACDHLMEILAFKPTGLEGMDHLLFEFVQRTGKHASNLKLLPEGKGFLLVEFGGDSKEDSDNQGRRCMAKLKRNANPPAMKLYDDPEEEEKLWKVRESGLGATAWVPGQPDGWPGWEDSAVPPEKVGPYLGDLRELFDKYDYHPSLYGHFGQGCIHCRVGFDLYTAEGVKKFRAFVDEAADLVVSYGGSLSGEHGDGQARAELLPKMFAPELMEAMREFKRIWDPDWKMNPGKVIDPYPITSNLRLGPSYNPPTLDTHFKYAADHHNFARSTLRCVGIGNCRQESGQIMCPSYVVTREEKDCTRGRARLLWEMLNGELKDEGWKSEAVRDSLDLCLACKGCKTDCPVNVDMATYKAEFLSHYYQGRLRPRSAYAMGWIYWWARLASLMPSVANFVSQTPILSDVFKFLGGIAPQRKVPLFAEQTFKEWFRQRDGQQMPRGAVMRGDHQSGKPLVILWPDTFNNHFHPEVLQAGVEVLESAGFEVLVPEVSLCCGRPLYDFGMLDTAERLLRQILTTLQPWIAAGVPVVGFEPSCVAVFRDELTNLFPHNEDAKRLNQQTFILSEFLNKKAEGYQPPRLEAKALVHGHCHHRAVMQFTDEQEVLKKMGLDIEVLKDTCCGMAGSFGFEKEHYDVSIAVAEHGVLPAVRQADQETLILTDGFSCREQIEQTTDRRPLHLAQVLQMALRQQGGQFSPPQTDGHARRQSAAVPVGLLLGVGAVSLAGLALWGLSRKQKKPARRVERLARHGQQ